MGQIFEFTRFLTMAKVSRTRVKATVVTIAICYISAIMDRFAFSDIVMPEQEGIFWPIMFLIKTSHLEYIYTMFSWFSWINTRWKIERLAREVGSALSKEFILLVSKNINVETYLAHLSLACRYGGFAHFEVENEGMMQLTKKLETQAKQKLLNS